MIKDIPLMILKDNKIFPQVLCKSMNDSLKAGFFPEPLMLAQITPIDKEEDPFDKDNNRLISILLLVSRIFSYIQ